jgi:hypothetical protein
VPFLQYCSATLPRFSLKITTLCHSVRSLRSPVALSRQVSDVATFEVALEAQRPFFYGSGTDEEADAATARVDEIARKIVALPATDIEMMRLKARIYLWSEATDFKTFAANNEGDGSSEAVLVSLFRDLGAADLDATPGPATTSGRAPAQHEEARSTAAPATEQIFSAYSDLEPQIRDLTHMADLARFHAINTFGSNSPDETEEGKREREVALFAVVHVEQMACDLEKAYEAGFRAARLRRATEQCDTGVGALFLAPQP